MYAQCNHQFNVYKYRFNVILMHRCSLTWLSRLICSQLLQSDLIPITRVRFSLFISHLFFSRFARLLANAASTRIKRNRKFYAQSFDKIIEQQYSQGIRSLSLRKQFLNVPNTPKLCCSSKKLTFIEALNSHKRITNRLNSIRLRNRQKRRSRLYRSLNSRQCKSYWRRDTFI